MTNSRFEPRNSFVIISDADVSEGRKTPSSVADLIREDMQRAADEMHRYIEEAIYRTSIDRPLFGHFYCRPVPWWKRAANQVRWYVVNLWRAIRGVSDDDDE